MAENEQNKQFDKFVEAAAKDPQLATTFAERFMPIVRTQWVPIPKLPPREKP